MKFFSDVFAKQNFFCGFYLMSKIKSAVPRESIISQILNFVETILPASLDNFGWSIVLKLMEILWEVILTVLYVMSISIPSQAIFWHGVQIDFLELGMRPAAYNA